jgi:DNA replication protein DnaC
MLGYKHLFGDHRAAIVKIFKAVDPGMFICSECKMEREYPFNDLFLMYDVKQKKCKDCEQKAERAIISQVINDKMNALKRYENDKKHAIDSLMDECGVPDIFLNACMGDLNVELSKAFDVEQSYFLMGGVGVGKSHMAVALMRQYLESLKPEYDEQGGEYKLNMGKPVHLPMFVEVPELLLRIRDTYRDSSGTFIDKGVETEKDIVDLFSKAPFLVLDDLGTEKASEFSTLMIYLIINRRSTSGRPTVITSNLELGEIRERLSDRISSRIKGMCRTVRVFGNDRRYDSEPEQG